MNTIKRAALIAIALVLEAVDRKITEEQNRLEEATQKPIEQPLTPSPTKYETVRIDTSSKPPARPYRIAYNPKTGIITSTTATSKYSPEQLNDMYKINPFTNL